MNIESARIVDGGLFLETASPDARRFVYAFKPGEYEIVRARKKRSLDANAYAWLLLDKIAGVVGTSAEEVYRKLIADMGGISEVLCIQEKAKDSFKRIFLRDHIGRQIIEQPSKIPGCVTLICKYGSSDFDTKQMSRFIDSIVQECQALGIETDTGRIQSLLEEWN